MIEILTVINKFLDLKIIQWALLVSCAILIVGGIWSGFKYNALKLEHAFLQVKAAQLSDGLLVQNAKVIELGEQAKVYIDNLAKSNAKAVEVQAKTATSLKAISEYVFDGDCSKNVTDALGLIKKGTVK